MLNLSPDRRATIVCDSGARPPEILGRPIYEVDTDIWRYWNGSAWSALIDPQSIGVFGAVFSSTDVDRVLVQWGVVQSGQATDSQGQLTQSTYFPNGILGVVFIPSVIPAVASPTGNPLAVVFGSASNGSGTQSFSARAIDIQTGQGVAGVSIGLLPYIAFGH